MADKPIGGLPVAQDLNPDSLLVMEQQGQAMSVRGDVLAGFAKSAVNTEVSQAAQAAIQAKESKEQAEKAATRAETATQHPPTLREGNDHWWIWDTELNDYKDSGIDAGVSIEIGDTITGEPGTPAKVTNRGTATDPILDFTIPKGDPSPVSSVNGETGDVVVQDTLSGAQGQAVGFDSAGKAVPVEVGGTNLHIASRLQNGLQDGSATITPQTLTGKEKIGDYISVVPGEIFTVQNWITTPIGATYWKWWVNCVWFNANKEYLSQISNGESLPTPQPSPATEEYKNHAVFTITVPEEAAYLRISARYYNDGKIKLERGSVATDWSPAPEDLLFTAGGEITGTLILSKPTDADANKDNRPALIVGGSPTGAHIEMDGNEIIAKRSGTAPDILYLNNDGGLVHIGAGGVETLGDLTLSGAARNIKYASGSRTGTPISFYKGNANGSDLVIGDGGRTIIGGGEAAPSLRTALGTAAADVANENLHLASDSTVQVHTNCNTIANRHTFTFQNDGRLSGVSNPTANTDAANKAYVDAAIAALKTQLGLSEPPVPAEVVGNDSSESNREE